MDYATALRKLNSDIYAVCKAAMRDPSVAPEDRAALRRMCGETDRLIDRPTPLHLPERTTA
jgi:hypothetical protein